MDKKRMKIIYLVFLVFIFVYVVRIGYFSLFLHRKYTYLSVSQRMNLYMYDSNRGDILDRNLNQITDRYKENMVVYSPKEIDNDQAVALVAREFDSSMELNSHHLLVEKSIRNCGVAQHLIGVTGYAPFHKIRGYQGLSGLERQFEKDLASTPAKVMMILDGKGMPVWNHNPQIMEGKKNPNKLTLTLDLDLQEKIEQVIDQEELIKRGSVVVMDPYNGQILSMISRPKMNYGNFDDGSHLNKAVQIHRGANPASVFKLIIALYALENGISDNEIYHCRDMCIFPHGDISFKEGLAKSCNKVFYDVIREFGPKAIIGYAEKLGIGQKTNIGLDNEGSGRLPNLETVKGIEGNRLLAMGQGELEVTPLQIAKITSIIANGGYNVKPEIIYYLGKNPKKVPKTNNFGSRLVTRESIMLMQNMMELTTQIGTARQLKGFGGVKTGTADNNTRWLTGYFPHEVPQYVVTIFIEEGHGKKTMDVSKRIIETIFE